MTLRGSWDEPRDGALLSRHAPLVVRGWHLWFGSPVVAVAVEVGGKTVLARPGSDPRPDVAAQLGDERAQDAGWRVTIEPPETPEVGGAAERSSVVVRVSVWGAADSAPVALGSRTVRLSDWLRPGDAGAGQASGPAIGGALDLPPAGERVARAGVRLRGWALGRDAPVNRVEVRLDDRSVGPAWLGLPRRDIGERHAQAHALLSGFERVIDLGGIPSDVDRVRLEVVAHADGADALTLVDRELLLGDAVPTVSDGLGDPHAHPPAPTGGPLKLAVFSNDLDLGGAQLWLTEMLRRSGAGRDFACTVISPRGGPLQESLGGLGIDVHVSQEYPLRSLASYDGRVAELSAWLAAGAYDAVLVSTAVAWIGADAARRAGVPAVWVIHESYPPALVWDHLEPGVVDDGVRRAFLRTLETVTAAVFVSEATRELYATSVGSGRSLTIPLGIDVAAIERYCERISAADARRKLGLPAKARVLLSVGLHQPRKAQTILAMAFAQVVDRHPDTHLVLVGDLETEYGRALRRYLRRAGLTDRVRVLPVLDEVAPWFRAADVMVCASYVESLPRTILEALAFGIPVAATSVFGIPDVVKDQVSGWLFEPGDVGAARGALIRAVETDRARLEQMGEAGRRLVAEAHNSDGYARDVLSLLEGVRAKPDVPPARWFTPSRHELPTG